MKCPSCGSPQISRRRLGKNAGSKIGALLGASIAAANATRGARKGLILGSVFGPLGATAGGITGALVCGICTGSMTSALGGAIGSLLDREVLNDFECQACGATFPLSGAYVDADQAAAEAVAQERTGLFGVPIVNTSTEKGSSDGAHN